jgi:hypothetical protein
MDEAAWGLRSASRSVLRADEGYYVFDTGIREELGGCVLYNIMSGTEATRQTADSEDYFYGHGGKVWIVV